MVKSGRINQNTAKEVLAIMFETGQSAGEVVKSRGWDQISDESQLAEIIADVLEENVDHVADYLQGKEKLRGWFVGQVMKATKGQANPKIVNRLLSQKLASLREK